MIIDALNTPRTWRARLVDILTPGRERDASVIAGVARCVAAGSLTSVDADSFGYFANASGDNQCAITSGDWTLTSASNPWTASDVGRAIDVAGAGPGGATLRTAIAAFTSAGSVELVDAAATTIEPSKTSAGGVAVWGDDWTDAINASTAATVADSPTLGGIESVRASGTTRARSNADVQADEFNILSFAGVDPLGIEDSTEAFEAALALLAEMTVSVKRTLRIPHGTYRITRGLIVPTFVDIVGDGRWRTRLMFELEGGVCISLAGADTSNRVRSTIRRLRIDGTYCTDGAVGVDCAWNQQQDPILDEVTIYGGYEAEGAETGLAQGLTITGPLWTASFRELGIEGVYGNALLSDLGAGEAVNIVNFMGGRLEGNRNNNIYLRFADDGIQSQQINFIGMTIQGVTDVGSTASVFIDGGKVAFIGSYFEGGYAPYEVLVAGGKASFTDCHWAWALRCVRVADAEACFSGQNSLWSSTSGISLGASAVVAVSGEMLFYAGGTPVVFDDAATARLEWSRTAARVLAAGTVLTSAAIGQTVTNQGAKTAFSVTMFYAPTGATLKVVQGYTSIRNATYRWVLSGSGTNEYYLELAAGGDPGFSDPTKFYDFATERTKGTLGALTANQWGFGDNDTLGFSTIYYRAAADPDSQSVDTLLVTYPITINPTNNQRLPFPGNSPSDSIVSDAVPGTSISMMNLLGQWMAESRTGTWT